MAITRLDANPIPYIANAPPNKDDVVLYLVNELRRLENVIKVLVNLSPQVAIAAPVEPLTGMIRWNKAPWNPLGTGDGLVKWTGVAWTAV